MVKSDWMGIYWEVMKWRVKDEMVKKIIVTIICKKFEPPKEN